MNRKIMFAFAMLVAATLPLAVMGQGQEKKGGAEKKDAAAGSVSITGCLNKGADADHYVIKDDKTGKETIVMGTAAVISRHANNHQVTLTGTMAKDKAADVLKVPDDGLKMIALCK